MMLFIICSDGWKSATTVWLNYLKIWSSYTPWSNIVRLIFVIFSQPNAIKSSTIRIFIRTTTRHQTNGFHYAEKMNINISHENYFLFLLARVLCRLNNFATYFFAGTFSPQQSHLFEKLFVYEKRSVLRSKIN